MTEQNSPQPTVQAAPLANGLHLQYLLYPPAGPDAQAHPLILFLHGAGERGRDVQRVRTQGLPRLLDAGRAVNAWVAAPQCPPGTWWTQLDLGPLLDDVQGRVSIDLDRVTVTGMSMGGYGTWATALRYPQRFAALAPVCGGGDARRAAEIAHIPQWVFHGALDDIVPVTESRAMVEALKAAGADVRYTEYPDVEHDSWDPAYETDELYEWLLSQRLR